MLARFGSFESGSSHKARSWLVVTWLGFRVQSCKSFMGFRVEDAWKDIGKTGLSFNKQSCMVAQEDIPLEQKCGRTSTSVGRIMMFETRVANSRQSKIL